MTRFRHRAFAAALMLLTLGAAGEGRGEPAQPQVSAADRESLNALHRLGPDARQLRFEGETMSRVWPIYVTAEEAHSRARVHVAYANAISVMPEASAIVVSVNDVAVAQSPIAAASDPASLDVELPRGLLQPGFNAVRITVSQRHRVDCSLEATYELWTQVDPATSGLTFPGLSDPSIVSLEDLPAISPDPTGAVVIHVVANDGAEPALLDKAMRAAESIAIRGGYLRPVVDVVNHVDARPGLYVAVGAAADLQSVGLAQAAGAGAGVSFAGDDVPGRTIVVVGGADESELDQSIRQILAGRWAETRRATPAAARALLSAGGFRIAGGATVSLHELGVQSEDFTGRLFRTAFDVVLPPDFYPADYDKLTLLVDAAYAAGLNASSQILVRVNDREAGSLPLRSPRGEFLELRPVVVSLAALRPGFNHIVVEAQTPKDVDKDCDVTALLTTDKRFTFSDRTELVIPPIARIARMPDLAVTASSGFPYERSEAAHLFLAERDPETLGAAATFLARAAVAARRPMHTALTFALSDLAQGSAILVGAPNVEQEVLASRFGLDLEAIRESWARPASDDASQAKDAVDAEPAPADDTFDQWSDAQRTLHPRLDAKALTRAFYDRYINVHREDFALFRPPEARFAPKKPTSLVLAQAQAPSGGADTWTILLASNGDSLARGLRALAAPSEWSQIEGRVVAYDPKSSLLETAREPDPYFIPTAALTPSNLRLVAAGWLSSDTDVYVIFAALGALALAVLTTATVKRYGVRQ